MCITWLRHFLSHVWLPEAEFWDGLRMLWLWTTNQKAGKFFTAISLDAHNNNIRNPSQSSASADFKGSRRSKIKYHVNAVQKQIKNCLCKHCDFGGRESPFFRRLLLGHVIHLATSPFLCLRKYSQIGLSLSWNLFLHILHTFGWYEQVLYDWSSHESHLLMNQTSLSNWIGVIMLMSQYPKVSCWSAAQFPTQKTAQPPWENGREKTHVLSGLSEIFWRIMVTG